MVNSPWGVRRRMTAPGRRSSFAVLSSMACNADWSIRLSPDNVVAAAGPVVALAPGDGFGTDEQPAISPATAAKRLPMWIALHLRCDCDCAAFSTSITRTLIHVLVRRSPGGQSSLLKSVEWRLSGPEPVLMFPQSTYPSRRARR